MGKKTWTQPEITVLVRHNPDEAVLADCKNWTFGAGNINYWSDCQMDITGCTPCMDRSSS